MRHRESEEKQVHVAQKSAHEKTCTTLPGELRGEENRDGTTGGSSTDRGETNTTVRLNFNLTKLR